MSPTKSKAVADVEKTNVEADSAKAGSAAKAESPAADAATAAPPVVTPSEQETPVVSNAQPAEKPLDFPKGALVAYRKSGGLKFSSREIIVYPDGRVTYDGGDTAKTALTRAARRMSDAQVMRLRRTLDQVNFFGMKPPPRQQDPDSFVIEIAARLGGKNNQIEVSAGNMPGALSPLIEQLTKLLPGDE